MMSVILIRGMSRTSFYSPGWSVRGWHFIGPGRVYVGLGREVFSLEGYIASDVNVSRQYCTNGII